MSAIEVLCEIIAQGGKARAASFRAMPGYGALLEAGFIRETGKVQAIGCEECDSPHDAAVVFEGGQYGFHCPDLGFVPLPPEEAIAVVPDMSRIVTCLADAFECKRRKTSPVQGTTWRVGAVQTAGGDASIYVHPRLTVEQDQVDLEAALAREVRSKFRLILTTNGGLHLEGTTTAQLFDVVALDSETSTLSATVDLGTIVGAPVQRVGGRPNQYREPLTRLINARIADGTALPGLNEEARAILALVQIEGSRAKAPAISTIKGYLTEIRAG